ncbi:unnamed protein product [Durusdinium trenchii]|uniref:Uncharacterized protein n=1 Tax=Durusdinium trenchii TaxID=1381693 RepID=A0ABP0LWJ4_9DINO
MAQCQEYMSAPLEGPGSPCQCCLDARLVMAMPCFSVNGMTARGREVACVFDFCVRGCIAAHVGEKGTIVLDTDNPDSVQQHPTLCSIEEYCLGLSATRGSWHRY